MVFGAVEIGVAAAGEALGSAAAAGPLLCIWGAGSLLGGVLAARAAGQDPRVYDKAPLWEGQTSYTPRSRTVVAFGRALRSVPRLPGLLVGFTAGHLALAAAANAYALAAVLFIAGAAIAPTYASVYALVERAAPAGTVTEAFAWLGTAVAVGAAGGAAAAGTLAERAGPTAVFALAGAAAACALLATVPAWRDDAEAGRDEEDCLRVPAAGARRPSVTRASW